MPPMPWNACHGGDTWKGRTATKRRTVRGPGPAFETRYDARTCGRPDSIRRKCSDGQREIAAAPGGRRDRQHALRKRDRHLRVRPRDQLAVRVQEGLQRKTAAIGLEHAFLVQDRRGRPACNARRRPVRLLAVQPARMMSARLARSDGVEEIGERAREAERPHIEQADLMRSTACGRLAQQQPQMPRATAARQVDVAAFALGLRRARKRRPRDAVVGALHFERAGGAGGRPVDDETAILVLAAEVEREPRGRRGVRAAPARRRELGGRAPARTLGLARSRRARRPT